MNDNLVALLKKHRIEQKKLQMALGSDFAHPEWYSLLQLVIIKTAVL